MTDWIRTELKEIIQKRIFNIPDILQPYLNLDYIKELWDNHQVKKVDNSWSIWAIYSLFEWVEKKMYDHAH